MKINEKNSKICMIIAITLLILLGTHTPYLSLIALLIALCLLISSKMEFALCLVFYLMPMASIFKLVPESQSFFTILEIVLCGIYFYKKNFKLKVAEVFIVVFSIYLLAIQIINGGFVVTTTIKMMVSLFIFSIACNIDVEKIYKKISLAYVYGIVVSSLMALCNSSFFRINDYIGDTEQRIGNDFIMRFSGLYSDPNYYTVNVVIALCLICILYYRKEISLKLSIVLSALLLIFAAITGSKSAFLMLIIPAFLFIYICKKKKKYGLLIMAITMFAIAIVLIFSGKISLFNATIERLKGSTSLDTLTTGRTVIWGDYFIYFKNHIIKIIFGNGINNVSLNGNMAHNTYIDLIYQLGIIGTLFWGGILYRLGSAKSNIKKRNFANYIILISVLVMYFFLSELQYYDMIFHLILCYLTFHISLKIRFV